MDLRAVRYAVTLAEELHFGRAAQRHFISQQPFGQRVRQLERELGFALFARSSRRVSLTPRGELFVAKAQQVLDQLDELADTAAPVPDTDNLVLGVLGFGLAELWAPARQALALEAPAVRLAFRDLDLVTQHRLVLTGEIDAGIVFHLGPMEGLVFDVAFVAPRVAVVPASSELAHRQVLRPADIADARWAPMVSTTAEMAGWLGPAAGQAHQRQALRRPESVASVVATTGAIGLHAAPAARYYPRPDVRYVPLEGPGCAIAVATREHDTRPAVQALRRAVATTLGMSALARRSDHNFFQ